MAGRISTLLNNAISTLMNLKSEVDTLDRQADLTENRNQNRAVASNSEPTAPPAPPEVRSLPVGKPPTVLEFKKQTAVKETPQVTKKTAKKGKKA